MRGIGGVVNRHMSPNTEINAPTTTNRRFFEKAAIGSFIIINGQTETIFLTVGYDDEECSDTTINKTSRVTTENHILVSLFAIQVL